MKGLRRSLPFAGVLVFLSLSPRFPAEDHFRRVVGTANNQLRVVNTYPEYWVDGKPFFTHSASFFYHRIPRDRWAEDLLRLKSMGINTIDLYPFWNWHQPEEETLDFDGHTNPRRDLKYLLRLIDLLGFKITYRPGPYYTSEWLNGGYPDWLLRRPEYHMSEQAILEGRYPRLSALQYDKSEEAATGWLKNETHLKGTRKWYQAVLGLANPLLAEKGGPLINIQIDDDQAIGRENYNGPNFWKYMNLLRRYADEATQESDIPYYINGVDMRVNAEANDVQPEPFWNLGQDYQRSENGTSATIYEAAKNKFFIEVLKTQPLFVPGHIEFQAGWLLDEKDTYALPANPSNTLIATRVMFQNGLKVLNYFPLNDTLDPAGYEAQWANYFYSWEAAVNYRGQETGRAPYVRRNGRLIAGMGPLLASSHLLPDAGLVYPMATFPQASLTEAEANHVANFAGLVLWSGVFDHYNFELVDSDHTPQENFERYKRLLLPNMTSGKEDLKLYPRLERYSEKAQRTMQGYVAAGGTLVVFPSLPKGKIFDDLLAPLGEDRQLPGDSAIRFSDGTQARVLGRHSVLTLPKKSHGEVKVFARDEKGGIVGARFSYGKGQLLFFGGDFSLWSIPLGTTASFEEGIRPGPHDYSEEIQKSARAALPALMKEAGVERKVDPQWESRQARDPGLYVTELVADWGSLPFEKRAATRLGYGFVGVTNLSAEEARAAEIVLTDPRASDLASLSPDRYLRLPRLTLPPRESLMLPIRLPLVNPFWEMAPGLEASDEVYYATSELTGVSYDGTTLQLEFTAPADGEVALRLKEQPQTATLDGEPAPIQADAEHQLIRVKIPRGQGPHFVRRLELVYSRQGPRITIDPREPWIAGEPRAVRVSLENPGATPLEGVLSFTAEEIDKPYNPPLQVHIPPRSSREFSFPVEIPSDAVESQPVEIVASFQEQNSTTTWAWRSHATVHRPFTSVVTPFLTFPLREDQAIPIVHPILASLDLPGEATFQVRVKNWRDHEQVVTVETEGANLGINPSSSHFVLAGNAEETLNLRVAPSGGSAVYRFDIRLHAGSYRVKEDVVLVAIRPGEAVAYLVDFDRDGFDDVILENQKLRCFISPHAGGRAFAYVLKDSNTNAFNSVGGMRDSFATRFEPEDMKDLPDWTRASWQGLYNRPYSSEILSNGVGRAQVRLSYEAPDIYPKGVKLERTLTLPGDQNVVTVSSRLTPYGIAKPQAYVLENSLPFRSFDEPHYNQWFARGQAPKEFIAQKEIDLGLKDGFIGTLNKKTGETFALMLLDRADRAQLRAERHSALIRITYPPFAAKNQTYTYRVAYYFGKEPPDKVENVFVKLKSER